MSLEAWSTVASLATLVVIAATAIAALAQMRHARSSNQIAAVTEMRETMESERFKLARRFVAEEVPKLLADPVRRKGLFAQNLAPEFEPIREVANFFETMGVFVKRGIIDRALVCDLWDGLVFTAWKQLEPTILIRRKTNYRGLWSNFEYLAVLCEKSLSSTQGEHYPHGAPRMVIDKGSLQVLAAFSADYDDDPKSIALR